MAASTGARFEPLGTEGTVGGFVEQFGTMMPDTHILRAETLARSNRHQEAIEHLQKEMDYDGLEHLPVALERILALQVD